jgi:hypothetical protein
MMKYASEADHVPAQTALCLLMATHFYTTCGHGVRSQGDEWDYFFD